jgi:hypothetical protein
MNIQIIITNEEDELIRGEYLTWESAEEGFYKLKRKFEDEQAKQVDLPDGVETMEDHVRED